MYFKVDLSLKCSSKKGSFGTLKRSANKVYAFIPILSIKKGERCGTLYEAHGINLGKMLWHIAMCTYMDVDGIIKI